MDGLRRLGIHERGKCSSLLPVMKTSLNAFVQSIFRFVLAGSSVLLLSGLGMAARPALAQAPVADSAAIEAKAHQLLAKLTLEQKVELLGGVDGMFTQAVPSIGLPRFKMSDGPVGG